MYVESNYDTLKNIIFDALDEAFEFYNNVNKEKSNWFKNSVKANLLLTPLTNVAQKAGILDEYYHRKQINEFTFEIFINSCKKKQPKADEIILKFIYRFITCHGKDSSNMEHIRKTFHAGYCYYFAHMLAKAFGDDGKKGDVCIMAPIGHFCWVDDNGVAYDIEGVYDGDAEYYIPERYLGYMVDDFKHIDGISYKATKNDIENVISRYIADVKHGITKCYLPLPE